MTTAKEDLVDALEKVAAIATEITRSATEFAAAISADPPQAATIGRAMQAYDRAIGKESSVALKVVVQATKRWMRLNPGLSQEKF